MTDAAAMPAHQRAELTDLESELESERHRPAGRGRLLGWLAVAVAVAAIGAGVLWQQAQGSAGLAVDVVVLGFEAVSEQELRLDAQLTVDPASTVVCQVAALSAEKAMVGWTLVESPPASTATRRIEVTLRTIEPAVTGLLPRCWLA